MTMETVFDFIEPFENFLTIVNGYGITAADARYFQAYREYLRLRSEGMTYYASLETVSERYGVAVGTMRTKVRIFSSRLKV